MTVNFQEKLALVTLKQRVPLPSKPSPLLSLHKCLINSTETREPAVVARDQSGNSSHACALGMPYGCKSKGPERCRTCVKS